MVGEADVRQTTCDSLLPPCGEKEVLQATDFICIQLVHHKTPTSQSAGADTQIWTLLFLQVKFWRRNSNR